MSVNIGSEYIIILIALAVGGFALFCGTVAMSIMVLPTSGLAGASKPNWPKTYQQFLLEFRKCGTSAIGGAVIIGVIAGLIGARDDVLHGIIIWIFGLIYVGSFVWRTSEALYDGSCHAAEVPRSTAGNVMGLGQAVGSVLMALPIAAIVTVFAFKAAEKTSMRLLTAMAENGVVTAGPPPAPRPTCRVEDLAGETHIYSLNGQADFGIQVQAKVTNLGEPRTFRVSSHMVSAQGTWDKATTINFGKEQALIVTLDFPEPVVGLDLSTVRYEVNCGLAR